MVTLQCILSMAFTIIPPVLPLLLPGMGIRSGAALRLWAGAILGVTPLAAALTSPLWGRRLEHVDGRWIILLSCCAAAVCTALMSCAHQPLQLLGLRFCMGLFGGHAAASMAIVTRASPTSQVGRALGFMSMAQLSGSLLGPLVGGGIADLFGSYRAPFFGAAMAVVLVGTLVARVPADAAVPTPSTSPVPHGRALPPRVVTLSLLVLLLSQWAILCPQPMISLYVMQLVGPRADLVTLAGFAFSIVALSGLCCAPLLGMLSDSLGERRVLAISVLGASLATVPQAFVHSYGAFIGERFVGGLFLAGILPSANTSLARTTPSAYRGRVYGLSASATFLGGFLGPITGGALGATFGLQSVFVGSACLLLATLLCLRAGSTTSSSQRSWAQPT